MERQKKREIVRQKLSKTEGKSKRLIREYEEKEKHRNEQEKKLQKSIEEFLWR